MILFPLGKRWIFMSKFSLWLHQAGARMSAGLRSFMSGRYGSDRLNMAILCAGLIASVFSSLFRNLTVLDNVLIGLNNEMKYSAASAILRLPEYWKRERIAKERTLELLSIFNMENVADHLAGSLPYGAQRRLEIVRALATNPCLLLLDEPAAGMNPSETAELMENIVKIRDTFHIAVMLIEHDMNLVMGICEGICVLNFGQVIAKGTADEIQANPAVIEAYLGKQKEA